MTLLFYLSANVTFCSLLSTVLCGVSIYLIMTMLYTFIFITRPGLRVRRTNKTPIGIVKIHYWIIHISRDISTYTVSYTSAYLKLIQLIYYSNSQYA